MSYCTIVGKKGERMWKVGESERIVEKKGERMWKVGESERIVEKKGGVYVCTLLVDVYR